MESGAMPKPMSQNAGFEMSWMTTQSSSMLDKTERFSEACGSTFDEMVHGNAKTALS